MYSSAQIDDRGVTVFEPMILIDPSLPQPKLQTTQPTLDFGVLPWQEQRTLDLEVTNGGSGSMQGRFVNIFACMEVEPVEFITHEKQTAKVTVDTGALTPSSKPQHLHLTIDAGGAGKTRLPVRVTVPEPKLQVSTPVLNLGTTYRGKV